MTFTPYTVEQFKKDLTVQFDDGKYLRHFIMADAQCLCHKCATEEQDLIMSAIKNGYDHQWEAVGCESFNDDEDNDIEKCAHCDRLLKDTY